MLIVVDTCQGLSGIHPQLFTNLGFSFTVFTLLQIWLYSLAGVNFSSSSSSGLDQSEKKTITCKDWFRDAHMTQYWPIAKCEPKGLWKASGTGTTVLYWMRALCAEVVLNLKHLLNRCGVLKCLYSDFLSFLSEPSRSGG